jgi:hypothetical protein
MLFPGTVRRFSFEGGCLKSSPLLQEDRRASGRVIDVFGAFAQLFVQRSQYHYFPLNFSATPASRMRVAFRALSVPRSSRACRALSTNTLRGQYGRFMLCTQLLPAQHRSVGNFRDRKRNDRKGFNSGFASASQVPDTIYALSTAAGRAAIAVIRISGPACLEVRLRIGRCPVRC